MSEEGKKKLRDLAQQVRAKVQPSGEAVLNKRGLDMVEELAKDLSGPEGMPGLKVRRDGPDKFRLERPPRNAEIAIEWQREIGALVMTCEKFGDPRTLVRYVWDDGAKHWRAMDGGGELYADLAARLTEYLYPEGNLR
jgi:hypothetical protein